MVAARKRRIVLTCILLSRILPSRDHRERYTGNHRIVLSRDHRERYTGNHANSSPIAERAVFTIAGEMPTIVRIAFFEELAPTFVP